MRITRIVRARKRLFAGAGLGLLAFPLLPQTFTLLTRLIIAWDLGCLTFLVLCAQKFTFERDVDLAADAAAQEEGEWTVFWITVGAVGASFAAIIGEFSSNKDVPAEIRGLHIGLIAVTLLVSWLMTHTVFALRYAHEYYEMRPGTDSIAKGLDFPGDQPPDYWDFFYFSLVLGMTFQVSDVQITARALRRLAAAQGLLSFLFNTVILALTVNIAAGLLS